MDVIENIKEKGIWEGMQKGRKEGQRKGRQEIALNMLKEKIEIAFINKLTGFSKEEIKKLKNQASQKSLSKTKQTFFSPDKFFTSFDSDSKLSQELLQLIFSKKEIEIYDLKKIGSKKRSF
ncbi:MAG: hypothetical protein GDA46_02300 [Bdellovibrionales bacterium]|nr:hypothetical protein [Bdellovibrionales bacterium]